MIMKYIRRLFILRDTRGWTRGLAIALAIAAIMIAPGAACSAPLRLRESYDVVVAGGGMGGMGAAIQAARLGASVLVVEPTEYLGGQAIAAGVSTMDDMSRIRSGIYLEFIARIRRHYEAVGKSMGTCYWDPRTIAFEPHVGGRMLRELADGARARGKNTLDILHGASVTEVRKDGPRVRGVTVTAAGGGKRNVSCRVLIDATEYGDVLPLAGAAYRAGNSVSPFVKSDSMVQDITWTAVIRRYSGGVPGHLRPWRPLPGYELAKRNYESYVTRDGANFRGVYPVALPVNFATHNAYRGLPDSSSAWGYDASKENWPHISKTGVNWGNDYPGKYSWEGRRGLPAAYLEDPAARLQIEKDALIKTLHFIYYMQNELGENWSVADDEYRNTTLPRAAEGLPPEWQELVRYMPAIPYVRESRRIIGEHTLTSSELLHNSLSYRDGQTSHEFPDAIAIGGYILDLHGADTDADMEWELEERAASSQINRPRGPFQVPMRALIPKDVEGLLAAEKNLSMSRLAAGALRLQPICMMTGQAAGALAALAAREGARLRDIPAIRVQWELVNAGVVLSLCNYADVPPEHPCYKSVQISNVHGLIDPEEYPHTPSYDITDLDDPVLAMAIIRGDDKGRFGVDELVTKSQMNSMIGRGRRALGLTDGGKADKTDKTGGKDTSNAFVSRGDFALALNEAFNLSNVRRPKGARSPFRASPHRNAQVLDVLGPLGVLDIYKKDPEFRFGRPVTRGEAACMLVRSMVAAKIPGPRQPAKKSERSTS